jgi:hypothetical protein
MARDDEADIAWFRVRDADALPKVVSFLRKHRVNTYSARTDRNGNPIMLFGWDDKPDSDWGKFRGHRAALWFADKSLAEAATPHVERALAWSGGQ